MSEKKDRKYIVSVKGEICSDITKIIGKHEGFSFEAPGSNIDLDAVHVQFLMGLTWCENEEIARDALYLIALLDNPQGGISVNIELVLATD